MKYMKIKKNIYINDEYKKDFIQRARNIISLYCCCCYFGSYSIISRIFLLIITMVYYASSITNIYVYPNKTKKNKIH